MARVVAAAAIAPAGLEAFRIDALSETLRESSIASARARPTAAILFAPDDLCRRIDDAVAVIVATVAKFVSSWMAIVVGVVAVSPSACDWPVAIAVAIEDLVAAQGFRVVAAQGLRARIRILAVAIGGAGATGGTTRGSIRTWVADLGLAAECRVGHARRAGT